MEIIDNELVCLTPIEDDILTLLIIIKIQSLNFHNSSYVYDIVRHLCYIEYQKYKKSFNIIIGMGSVETIDSTTLGVLLHSQNELLKKERQIVLCDVRQKIMDVLTMMGTNKFIKTCDTLVEALEYINKPLLKG